MKLVERFRDLARRLTDRQPMEPSRTRAILLYLCFVLISALLWCFLTFNKPISVELSLPMRVVSVPREVKFLTTLPDSVTMSVTAKGTTFIKSMFKRTPTIELRFSDFASQDDGLFKVDAARLKRELANRLGREMNIHTVQPESITARFTNNPGKKIPLITDVKLSVRDGYMQTGPLTVAPDTVTIYGTPDALADIDRAYTYHVEAVELTDTFNRTVSVKQTPGTLTEPKSVKMTLPIERLVEQSQTVLIQVRNLPDGINVVLLPPRVKVKYKVPQSEAKKLIDITAVVDYNNIDPDRSNLVQVTMGEYPGRYDQEDFSLDVEQVEYIIQK